MADEEDEYQDVTAGEFAELLRKRDAGGTDAPEFTVVDLREPDELIVFGIEGAINIPFSQVAHKLDEVPKDRPVYVVCRTGDWSEQVAELLADRGYEAYNVTGGTQALRQVLSEDSPEGPGYAGVSGDADAAPGPDAVSAADDTGVGEPIYVDARGLRCPGPIVKVADTLRGLEDGQAVYVEATEDAFASDIAVWADRTGNRLESLDVEPGVIRATVRKTAGEAAATGGANPAGKASGPTGAGREDEEHEKTFVVFSGDLDKTIAAFIMANGGAAMGRKVTMFFTFWGLNVLRKPQKVKVHKNLVEKVFGAMMPRGTKKLGLSRMNMLGAGPKMIRWLMREKGISSLEELVDDARAHGVRLVACQMSMDIMGIKKEELIDGVELGGVATMLGSAEKSDLTYFI